MGVTYEGRGWTQNSKSCRVQTWREDTNPELEKSRAFSESCSGSTFAGGLQRGSSRTGHTVVAVGFSITTTDGLVNARTDRAGTLCTLADGCTLACRTLAVIGFATICVAFTTGCCCTLALRLDGHTLG